MRGTKTLIPVGPYPLTSLSGRPEGLQKGGAISACSIYKSTLCMIAIRNKLFQIIILSWLYFAHTLEPSAKENFPETLIVTIVN